MLSFNEKDFTFELEKDGIYFFFVNGNSSAKLNQFFKDDGFCNVCNVMYYPATEKIVCECVYNTRNVNKCYTGEERDVFEKIVKDAYNNIKENV